jgi:mycofactocin precursor
MERTDTAATDAPQATDDDRLDVTDEVLVEEVSIDGMCGVY